MYKFEISSGIFWFYAISCMQKMLNVAFHALSYNK